MAMVDAVSVIISLVLHLFNNLKQEIKSKINNNKIATMIFSTSHTVWWVRLAIICIWLNECCRPMVETSLEEKYMHVPMNNLLQK